MTKSRPSLTFSAYMRSRRAQVAWKVPTHMPRPRPPVSFSRRSRISPAALLVKVTARMRSGQTPRRRSSAMRKVMTRVLPEPAPARISRGPPGCRTPSRCAGLSLSTPSLTRFYIAGMDSTRRAALQAGALVALADAFALRRAWGPFGERVAIALAVGAIVVGAALLLTPWLALLADR